MDEIKSNAEIKSEARDWVAEVSAKLDADESRTKVLQGPFIDPWTLAVTIGELISRELRWRADAPNKAARLQYLRVAHAHNLLNWPVPDHFVLRVRPDNMFDPPSRGDMLEALAGAVAKEDSFGDVIKIEAGWAVAVCCGSAVPEAIPGFTLRKMISAEIDELPEVTQSGVKKLSVASPRIDAVASKALKPSREQVKKLLSTGGVLLNYEPARKPGYELVPNDIVAVRGGGIFRFIDISDVSKKGRVYVEVEILSGA